MELVESITHPFIYKLGISMPGVFGGAKLLTA